jgi:hypothetical protein
MRALKAFADLVRTTSFLACVHDKDGQDFRLQLQRRLIKFMFASMECSPSAIYDMKWRNAFTATPVNSVRLVFASVKRHFGIRRAFVMLPEAMSTSEDIWQR